MQTPKLQQSEKMDIREIQLTHNNKTKKEAKIEKILGANRKKYSVESLYSKMLFNICNNNTAYINYNKYGTKGFKLSPISTIFSDNIIMAGLIPIQEIPKDGEDVNNRFIKYYRNIIYNFLLQNNVKDVKPKDIKLQGIRKADGETGHIHKPNITTVRDFYRKFLKDTPEQEQEVKAQHFKIALANISYEETLKLFNKKNLRQLEENFIYKSDIDWTQDFKGSFNKDEIIEHLINNCGFRMQDDKDENEDYKDHVILKNDKSVGRNCLTFFYNNKRYKLYLKFVHSLEVKSNAKQIGNNIREWVNNPEPRLKETIKQSLNFGFTRAEITFYSHVLPEKEEIEDSINYLYNLVPEELTYCTPINKSWEAYTEAIKSNYLLLDTDNKNVVLCYSVNKLTKRTSGIIIEKYKDTDIYYLISKCLFNLPLTIVYISYFNKEIKILKNKKVSNTTEEIQKTGKKQHKETIEETKEEKFIFVSYNNYVVLNKAGSEKETYVISPNNIYVNSTDIKDKYGFVNTPEEQGLVHINNINLIIPETNNSSMYRAKTKDHLLTQFYDIEEETNLDFLTPKEIEENENVKTFEEKNNILETLQNNRDTYNNFIDQENKKIQMEQRNTDINDLFNTLDKSKLTDLQDGEIINIIAVRETNTKYGNTYICLDKYNNKVIWVNNSLKKYINVILPKLFFNNCNVYHLENYEEILTIKKISEYLYEGTKCAKIDIKANRKLDKLGEALKEQQEEYNKISLEHIDNAVKEKECYCLNDLEEGQQYTIIGFTKKLNGKKEKYLLKLLEKGENIYISNSFLEDKIKENGTIENRTLIKIGPLKTDKNKRKHRTIFY